MATEVRTNVASPGANPAPPAATAPAAAAPEGGAPVAAPPAEAKPAEVPEAAPPKPEKAEVDFSTRFAALTKREKATMERERAVKAAEKELSEYRKAKENAKLDPAALLEAHGLGYNELTEFFLNDRKLTDAQRLALVEERLKKDADDRAAAAAAAQSEEVQSTIGQHKQAIKEFIEQGGDEYELTRSHEAEDLVYDVIETHWNETYDQQTGRGEVLPIAKAAKAVEDHLENMAREKVLKLKRFQPKQEVKEPEGAPAPEGTGHETKRPAPTLTNSSVSSAPPPDNSKNLSDEESKRRAAAMLRWTN